MKDDEVEDRLRDALRQFAGDAPPGASMLTTVTTESARRGRRSRLAVAASGAAALVAIGAAIPFALRGGPAPAPAQVGAASPTATAVATPSSGVPGLVASTVPGAVAFPFESPFGGGYGEPQVMLAAARPTLMQTLPTGAGVSVALYTDRPAPPTSKARASDAKVGGQAATVYQWAWSDDDPSNPDTGVRISLVWHPSAESWLRLDADAGVPQPTLTGYAAALKPGLQKSLAPFAFRWMPDGWTVDNITGATVTFAPPGVGPDQTFIDKIAVQLDESPGLEPKIPGPETVEVRVGDRKAWLTTSSEGQLLQVPSDGGHSLLLQIGPRAVLPRDLLLRFAGGIIVTPAAQVSRG